MITGGKSYVSSAPAFSNDAKKLLVCTGNTVSIFSTSTAMKVTELVGHKSLVTAVIVVPASASKPIFYCWTSSLDGSICYWDFSLSELIKRVEIQFPIFSMVIPSLSKQLTVNSPKQSHLYSFISVEGNTNGDNKNKCLYGQIRMCDLNKGSLVGGIMAETPNPVDITISKSGKFFGIPDNHKLRVWKVPGWEYKFGDVKKIKLHHTKKLTVLAFHPTEGLVAGGDVTGRILLWRGFGKGIFSQNSISSAAVQVKDKEERPGVRGDDHADSCSTWHWHANEVNFLSFSSDGAYLYSGGREGVIVIWQLDTGKKKFLPRLGAPLLYYSDSADSSLASVSCGDNRIHLLKMPSMKVIKSFTGIKPPCSFPDIYEGLYGGFAFDKTTGLAALRTNTYSIQFYNLFDNREVSEVQVCERNFLPNEDITVVVVLVSLSLDASKMSTVEVKLPEDGVGGLVSLRFWAARHRGGEYSLSTVIYEPHGDSGISAVAFHPAGTMAVTSSFVGDFKIWSCPGVDQKGKYSWRCQSIGSYKKKPMTAAAFSADGSVLAVAAECIITLWNPNTNALVAVIGDTISTIRTLSFIGKSEYLISVSQGSMPQLSVWRLSNLSLSWSYKLLVEAVTSSTDGSRFAVLACLPNQSKQNPPNEKKFREDGVILIFSVEDPIPTKVWFVQKAKRGILALLDGNLSLNGDDVEGEKYSELLVYLNGDREYAIFDTHTLNEEWLSKSTIQDFLTEEEKGQSGYTSLYGKLPKAEVKNGQMPEVPFVPADRPWETIFNGSSHALPSLPKLCEAFLSSLLQKTTST